MTELLDRKKDDGEVLLIIKLQTLDDAEAVSQRRSEQTRSGRSADEGEGRQVQFNGTRRRSLTDEEHVPGFEVGEQGGQIPGSLENGAGGLAQIYAEFVGDDVRQGRFAETGGAEDKQVIQRLVACRGRFDENSHLTVHGGLADVLGEPLRADAVLQAVFLDAGKRCYQAL